MDVLFRSFSVSEIAHGDRVMALSHEVYAATGEFGGDHFSVRTSQKAFDSSFRLFEQIVPQVAVRQKLDEASADGGGRGVPRPTPSLSR